MLHKTFSTHFGFTEPEVEALLARVGWHEQLEAVQRWYNGHVFARATPAWGSS